LQLEVANRIADEILSRWPEADIANKHSGLGQRTKSFRRDRTGRRLEFIRDISIAQAVYQDLLRRVFKEYVELTEAQAKAPPGSAYELPLVEQFKNQVRGIIESNRSPAPAAIALALSDKYIERSGDRELRG